ncbi:hypothetical protein M758_8G147600 [Ceratodon purpureus]|uniref:Uncharacterized protein n=1 Tax=Ceratodon purpureus TaxID=3225 RepID=A0A8T0H1D5_CERPU|nr:hypothetical protein KC19_8G151600 [Ceratodon purpureus]KAG0608970.1 hypothetical protein M758_8G147600 [Ceratodon purpureus]
MQVPPKACQCVHYCRKRRALASFCFYCRRPYFCDEDNGMTPS